MQAALHGVGDVDLKVALLTGRTKREKTRQAVSGHPERGETPWPPGGSPLAKLLWASEVPRGTRAQEASAEGLRSPKKEQEGCAGLQPQTRASESRGAEVLALGRCPAPDNLAC